MIEALGAWGVRWAFGDPQPEELDAGLLVWKIHQRIHRELLPERRTVVEFDFTGPRAGRVWLLLEPREVSVCVTPPGFDSDLVVRRRPGALLSRLARTGRVRVGAAVRGVDGRRTAGAGRAAAALVHVEPDGAVRPRPRAGAGRRVRAARGRGVRGDHFFAAGGFFAVTGFFAGTGFAAGVSSRW